MSVFLDLAGVSGTAFFNLLDIARGDGGLGLTDVMGDATVFQITYNEAPGQGPTADRLNTLVNTDFGTPIVITALNGGNDPHGGGDVTGNGFTYTQGSGSSMVIRVVYDVSQACGAQITTFDVNGNKITTPNPVILYHELSHAFHIAINQTPFPQNACPGNTTDEPAAEIDENVLRTALGLCQRDVCNHNGGTGAGSDCGGSAGSPDSGPPAGGCPAGNNGGCFIVSAATGSPESEEINQLRRLRNRVAAVSGLGAQLIDLVYGEYFQFSPAVAEQLAGDVIARQAVLAVVVRPLLAWYALAGTLGPGFENRSTENAARAVVDACPALFGRSAVADALAALQSGGELSPGAARALGPFAHRIREVAGMRFVAWAILDPLARLWSAAARDSDMVHEVAQWLAAAPLEATVPPTDPAALDREIAALARLLAFRPEVKLDLGPRLAAAWPGASGMLARHGFLAGRPKQGDPS
jgi:hypothetical protein